MRLINLWTVTMIILYNRIGAIMILKTIELNGNEYELIKKIHYNNKTYAEYRNKELSRIQFYEVQDEILKEISNKEELKKMIRENYVTTDMIGE